MSDAAAPGVSGARTRTSRSPSSPDHRALFELCRAGDAAGLKQLVEIRRRATGALFRATLARTRKPARRRRSRPGRTCSRPLAPRATATAAARSTSPAWSRAGNKHIRHDFDTSSSAPLREFDERKRSVQKSAESTSFRPSSRMSTFGRDVPNHRLFPTQAWRAARTSSRTCCRRRSPRSTSRPRTATAARPATSPRGGATPPSSTFWRSARCRCRRRRTMATRRPGSRDAPARSAPGRPRRPKTRRRCYQGHVGVARLLRRHGCSLEHANRNGATPLYAAAQQDQADVVAFLLESGVAVDAAMADGRGPRATRPPARDVPPTLRRSRFG